MENPTALLWSPLVSDEGGQPRLTNRCAASCFPFFLLAAWRRCPVLAELSLRCRLGRPLMNLPRFVLHRHPVVYETFIVDLRGGLDAVG